MSDRLEEFRRAVALDLMTLARLHDRELDASDVIALQQDRFPHSLAFRLLSTNANGIIDTLATAVRQADASDAVLDELAADYAAIYLNHTIGAAPYESVWLDDDGLAMQEPMFEVRAMFARYGLQAQDWRKRADDHLVHQIQFVALLFDNRGLAELQDAADFLDDHTLRWLPDLAERVAARAATPFYASLAALTAVYLDELRDVLSEVLDRPRPTAEQVAERNKRVHEAVLPMPSSYVPGGSPSW